MFNFDYITQQSIKKDNPSWPEFSEYPCRILIV